MGQIRIGDEKTRITATIVDEGTGDAVNVSTATTKQLIFRRPDQSIETKSASFTTDGSDGKIYYLAEEDFFDQVGVWTFQGYVALGASGVNGKWKTEFETFTVYPNLN
jgi:hypothetical protein